MENKINILGIGRCIIGHLAKTLNENYSDQVFFKHHYLLNYNTCIKSKVKKEYFEEMKNIECMPRLYDQFFCLDRIEDYNICAIEIFKPSQLYKYKLEEIYACFENFSEELRESGFEKSEYIEDEYKSNYIYVIESLIKKIKLKNQKIKIVLVNGELIRQNENKLVGSVDLNTLITNTKSLDMLKEDYIQFLDMNDLISRLELDKVTTYEVAFPYVYFRHSYFLEPIEFARDCKHAIPSIRIQFLNQFCNIIKGFGFLNPKIIIDNNKLDFFDNDMKKRAQKFIDKILLSNNINDKFFNNAKEFSLFVSYALETKDIRAFNVIKEFSTELLNLDLLDNDFKDYFYHIRTISAFEATMNIGILDNLIKLGIKILNIKDFATYVNINFILLWIKDIYIVLYVNYSLATYTDKDRIKYFNKLLVGNKFLNKFSEIKIITKKLNNI